VPSSANSAENWLIESIWPAAIDQPLIAKLPGTA
jgi:hypothetical protein